MKKRIFTKLILIVAILALTAVGEEKPLSLEDTKWKLVGFVDVETGELEEPDYSMFGGGFGSSPYPTPPDFNTDDWFTLEFLRDEDEYKYYVGKLTSQSIYGAYIVDYARSNIDLEDRTWLEIWDGTTDGQRYYWALGGFIGGSHKFELTDTSLKIYCSPRNSEKLEYLLFKPWQPAPSKILDAGRIVLQPQSDQDKGVKNAILPPEIILSASDIAAGPNPVAKSVGFVNFYRVGKQVKTASLKIYDASGKAVNKIAISDKSAIQNAQSKRQVGSWNLKDAKGRPVPEGTYLVKGAVKTVGGKSEKIASLISVR